VFDLKTFVEKTGIKDITKIEEILKEKGYKSIFTWNDTKGTFYDWHFHSYEEVRWVIEGSITIGTEEGEFTLKPGDVLYIKPETKHWAKTDTGVTYICASK
jgi:quercetin dioxygenase-like cupin family protein